MEKTIDFLALCCIIFMILYLAYLHDFTGCIGWFVAGIWACKYLSVKEYK